MISLVTQSDGSARRLPIVSIALALAMAGTFLQLRPETERQRADADSQMLDVIDYFEEHPYVVLPDGMASHLPAERVEEMRAGYEEEWKEVGLVDLPERLVQRAQSNFDGLAQPALARYDALPANVHAFRGADSSEPIRYLDHAVFHASAYAMWLSVVLVLLLGIALEDVWGSIVFGVFCAAMVPLGAMAFGALAPASTQLWLGGSGLVAALLGASTARWFTAGSPRLLGGLPLAIWWLAPVWLCAEYLVARELGWATMTNGPLAVHLATASAGMLLALVIRRVGLEETLTDRWDDSKDRVRNRKLDAALELRGAGKREEALAMLEQSFRKRPDPDTATAMWDVSKELATPEIGAPAALWRVRDAVRSKQLDAAIEYWLELVAALDVIPAEPPVFVKLSEILAEAGRRREASESVDRMLSCGQRLTFAVAQRAAQVVAQTDPELANRVATAAIDGGSLSAREREKLAAFVIEPEAPEPEVDAASVEEAEPLAESRVPGGEPLRVKMRVLPAFKGLRVKKREPARPAPAPSEPDPEPALGESACEVVDPNAIDGASLEEDTLDTAALASATPDSGAGVFAEFDVEGFDLDALDPNALAPDLLGDEAAPPDSLDAEGPAPATASDVAEETGGHEAEEPIDEAIGESRAADPDEVARWNSPGLVEDLSDQLPDAGTAESNAAIDSAALGQPDAPAEPEASVALDASGRLTRPILDDAPPFERERRVIGAVPHSLDAEGIRLDAEGKGKTCVPFARIEAIAVGAVRDLGMKPVVVIDLLMNWSSEPSESLKLLRIRSDQFDPRALVPGATDGVAALRAFIAILVDRALPECLPDEASVLGQPFAMYDSLADHERQTLG